MPTGQVVMTPFLFLILVVGISFLNFFISLTRDLSLLLIFSKQQLSISLIFSVVFLFSVSLIFALVFISFLFVYT